MGESTSPWILPVVLIWFSIPWIIGIFKVFRRYRYEKQHNYTARSLDPFSRADRLRKFRKDDPAYNQLHLDVRTWGIVITVWWFASFSLLAIGVVLFSR